MNQAVKASTLQLVYIGDPALTTKAEPITTIDASTRRIADQMLEIMRKHRGIGLAANQVGLLVRMFVCEVPEGVRRGKPQVHINPRIVRTSGSIETAAEGCLSHPGVSVEVTRPSIVTMESTDLDGNTREHLASGLLARCWQHEIDHLDGVNIIDHLPVEKR